MTHVVDTVRAHERITHRRRRRGLPERRHGDRRQVEMRVVRVLLAQAGLIAKAKREHRERDGQCQRIVGRRDGVAPAAPMPPSRDHKRRRDHERDFIRQKPRGKSDETHEQPASPPPREISLEGHQRKQNRRGGAGQEARELHDRIVKHPELKQDRQKERCPSGNRGFEPPGAKQGVKKRDIEERQQIRKGMKRRGARRQVMHAIGQHDRQRIHAAGADAAMNLLREVLRDRLPREAAIAARRGVQEIVAGKAIDERRRNQERRERDSREKSPGGSSRPAARRDKHRRNRAALKHGCGYLVSIIVPKRPRGLMPPAESDSPATDSSLRASFPYWPAAHNVVAASAGLSALLLRE